MDGLILFVVDQLSILYKAKIRYDFYLVVQDIIVTVIIRNQLNNYDIILVN